MSISNINFDNNALTTINHPTPALINCPKEIIALICSYLNSSDVVQLVLTNRTFCCLASNDSFVASLWNLFLHKDFPNSYTATTSATENFTFYKNLKNAVHNIKAGKYRLLTLNGHRGGVECMMLRDGTLISGSEDDTIKIWNLSSGKALQTLNGHQAAITCITTLDNNLISGSEDDTIKIWNLSTGKELLTLSEDQGVITCMVTLDGKLIVGLRNGAIKIWDHNTGQKLQTLSEHQGVITCMTNLDDKLIVGLRNGTIKILDQRTGKELQMLSGHQSAITCMTTLDGKLIVGLRNGRIKIWDLSTGRERQTLNGHRSAITCMMTLDGNLIAGLEDGEIKIWDLRTGKELQTLNGHSQMISSMMILNGQLFSGSRDNTIKIWDFNFPSLSSHFNFPSLSSHSKKVLEENLAILGQMAHAENMNQSEVVEELTEKLHPDFKERLKQHSYKTGSYQIGSFFSCSKTVILRVQTEVCVEALLAAIHDQDDHRVSELVNQLIWIDPQNNKIYKLLWETCGKPDFDNRWGEYAFYNQQGYSASSLQKEQAVIEFKKLLKVRWGKDLPLLLVDFGIVTKKEYIQKLNCKPDDLATRGICSAEDLQALYLEAGLSDSPNFQYLQIVSEEAPKDLIQSEAKNFKKQEVVSALLDQLFDAAQKKLEETKPHSIITDENGKAYDANPWIAFLEKLKNAQADLNTEGLTRRQFAEKFNPEAYAELVKKANALIDEFRAVERKTQMMILHAYLNQWGIFKKWEEDLRGINGLSALLKTDKAPQDIFRMGK